MSGKIVGWAFAQKCRSASQKLVLAKISENANEQGECFPSVKRIAAQVQLTPKTVRRALHELALDGFVTITPRYSPRGQTANLYQIAIPAEGPLTAKHAKAHHRDAIVYEEPSPIYSGGPTRLEEAPHSLQTAVHLNSNEPSKNLPPIRGCDTPAMMARVTAFRNAIGHHHFEAWFKTAVFIEGPPVTIQFAGKTARSIAPARYREPLERHFGDDLVVTYSIVPNAVSSKPETEAC